MVQQGQQYQHNEQLSTTRIKSLNTKKKKKKKRPRHLPMNIHGLYEQTNLC